MKIHAMYGLDLPSGGASGGPLATRLPNGPWQTYVTNGETTTSWTMDVAGWVMLSCLAGAYNNGNYRFKISADLKEIVPTLSPTSNLYIGKRLKTGQLYSGSNVFGVSSNNDVNNNVIIFSTSDLPAYAIGKSYYLETNLNFATSTINRRVDGKLLTPIAMPAWMATAVSATPGGTSVFLGIGWNGTSYSIQNGETHKLYWRDFYCIEWEAGEVVQFLGPQVVEKIPANAAVATGWVASVGDATSVLKTGYSNPSTAIGAPTLTTDDPMTPASITYDASVIPQNAVINGVVVKGRSAVSVNATANLGVSLTVGGVETADTTTPMVAAQTWYDKMFTAFKTPAGQPWYQPNLAGLTVKLKPKV